MNKYQILFRFVKVFLFYFFRIQKQKRFFKFHLEKELLSVSGDMTNVVKQRLINRCRLYAVTVPAGLGESFCILRGKKMAMHERFALTCLGGLTGLFDDLVDENKLTDDQIMTFVEMKSPILELVDLKLMRFLYDKFIQYTTNSESIDILLKRVASTQIMSRLQYDWHISEDQLYTTVADKGGVALLAYRMAFDGLAKADESEIYYNLGAIGQEINDIFDVYRDLQSGICTLANRITDVDEYRSQFEKRVENVFFQIKKNGFENQNAKDFLQTLLMIVAAALICLDNYQLLQIRSNGVFTPARYDRKELICDLGKPSNIFRLIKKTAEINDKYLKK